MTKAQLLFTFFGKTFCMNKILWYLLMLLGKSITMSNSIKYDIKKPGPQAEITNIGDRTFMTCMYYER